MDKKLDLSSLTDEEAKHVLEVVQRDLELRKKEKARLGELKTMIEKEDTKRELLSSQSNLNASHCIRCLQPFKFLVNIKRQCLDCHFNICKTCSRYNTKEYGWVCDPCRLSRILKIGTLGWYHENIRARFKRFGSAKVMRSLFKRLNEEDVYNGHDDEHMDAMEAQHYKQIRNTKRLLSVHPLDLDNDDYSSTSRRNSVQYIHDERGTAWNDLENSADMYHHHHRLSRRKSMDRFSRPDDGMYSEHRVVRARSLSKIPALPQRSYYLDTSEEEDAYRFPVYQFPARRRSRAFSQDNITYSTPPINELNKRIFAIESLLNRLEEKMTMPNDQQEQVSASQLEEERLKKKLEQLISDRALSSDEDEPNKLIRTKGSVIKSVQGMDKASMVHEAALSSSSDEMPTESQKRSIAAALCDITTEILRTINATENAMSELVPSKPNDRPQLVGTDVKQADAAYRELEENVYLIAGKSFDMEGKLRQIELCAKNHYTGPLTDSELSEMEDHLAAAAAKVQDTESEVSGIENKIAVLSASGLSIEKAKKRGIKHTKTKKVQGHLH